MKEKTCSKCNITKPISEFRMRYDEYYINPCNACYKIYQQAYNEKKKAERIKIEKCCLPQGTYTDGTKIECKARPKYVCPYCKRTFCIKCYEFLQYRCMCTPVLLDIKKYNLRSLNNFSTEK